jgi:hypothetical protein
MTLRPLLFLCLLSACDWSLQRMDQQARCSNTGSTARLHDARCRARPPPGTVTADLASSGESAQQIPRPSLALLKRGRQRFEQFCTPCHGFLGDGQTVVASLMEMRKPASLHEARLLSIPDAHIARVIEEGYGLMPSYASVLDLQTRWAIVFYVRALQRSQQVRLAQLPEDLRREAQPWLR